MHLLTTDIYEGAYLLSQGMQIEKLWLNGKNGKRSVVFEFTGPQVELLRKDYQKGRASANVTKLKNAITDLKDKMFTLLRSQETPNVQAPTGQAERRRENYEQSTIQV